MFTKIAKLFFRGFHADMDIETRGYVGFTSRNCPVKPFTVQTRNDIITFKEIDYTKKSETSLLKRVVTFVRDKFIKTKESSVQDIATFFLDNFAHQSSHPFWKLCRKDDPAYNKKIYKEYLNKEMVASYKKSFDNPDTTVLIGKDSKNKIRAGIITEPLNLSEDLKNDKTLYIDSLAVDKDFRNNHLGKQMIDSVVDSNKEKFDDTFLVAYTESVPFYEKQGFKSIEDEKIIKGVAKERCDFPVYALPLNKIIEKGQKSKSGL